MRLSVLVECPYHRYKDISTSVSASPRWTFCLFIEANKFVPKRNSSPPMFDRHTRNVCLHSIYTDEQTDGIVTVLRLNEWMKGQTECVRTRPSYWIMLPIYVIIAFWCLLIFCNSILIIYLHVVPFHSGCVSRCFARITFSTFITFYAPPIERGYPHSTLLYYDESINWFLSQFWQGEADFWGKAIFGKSISVGISSFLLFLRNGLPRDR